MTIIRKKCPKCEGTGWAIMTKSCRTCDQQGYANLVSPGKYEPEYDPEEQGDWNRCPHCIGIGYMYREFKCDKCDGRGYIEVEYDEKWYLH